MNDQSPASSDQRPIRERSLTSWALAVVASMCGLAIAATVIAATPIPVDAAQVVGTWEAVEHGVDSSIHLREDGLAAFDHVPMGSGRIYTDLGTWSLESPNGYPNLYFVGERTGLSLSVDASLLGIQIVTYRGDPDESNSEVVYRRQ